MNPDKDVTTAHWSRDFVEHLRSVQFSLVAVSLGLILIVSAKQESATSRAKADLDDIASIARGLETDWVSEWCEKKKKEFKVPEFTKPAVQAIRLEEGAREGFDFAATVPVVVSWERGAGPKSALQTQTFRFDDSCPLAQFEKVPSSAAIRAEHMTPYREQWIHMRWGLLSRSSSSHPYLQPATLSDFEQLWNDLNNDIRIVVPLEVGSNLRAANKEGNGRIVSPITPLPRDVERLVTDVNRLKVQHAIEGSTAFELKGTEGETHTNRTEDQVFVLRDYGAYYVPILRWGEVVLNGQEGLKRRASDSARRRWSSGTFAQTFPDLNTLTRGRRNALFQDWQDAFKEELQHQGEPFEAFGLRVPAKETIRWGAILVVGIQAYLAAHLIELARKLRPEDPGWEVAWLGVYRHFLGRSLFVMSTLVLPVVAVGALGLAGVLQARDLDPSGVPLAWLISALGILPSITLAFITAIHIPRPDR